MYETIQYSLEEGVGSIVLNRPERLNAFTRTMHKELKDALTQADRDPEVRALMITGAGRAFCAGQDLTEAGVGGERSITESLRESYNVWIMKLRSMEKPVVAAVNGVAAGAGCSLALACDLILMSEKASFIQAFSKIGLVPDSGASYFLPRAVGYYKAMELALFGDKVTAQEALQLGLCNRVLSEEELLPTAREWARRLARGPRSLGWTKRLINRGLDRSLPEVLEMEAMLQAAAGRSEDAREGIAAFVEKREARFTGR